MFFRVVNLMFVDQHKGNRVHFTRGVHRTGGEHEVWRSTVQSNVAAPELPQRFVLKPNLHYGRQDTANCETRASVDHLSREYGETRSDREFGETRCGNIDCRIQSLPHSNDQQQDDTLKEAVKKLIHQFETHPNRDALKADMEKDQAFNPVSEKVEGRQALYTVLAEHACGLKTKIANETKIGLMFYRFRTT